jgi:hypothetical protein
VTSDDDSPRIRTDLRRHNECQHIACLMLDHCQWPDDATAVPIPLEHAVTTLVSEGYDRGAVLAVIDRQVGTGIADYGHLTPGELAGVRTTLDATDPRH